MEDEVRIINAKKSILEKNDEYARALRDEMKKKKTLLVNIMSSPGSGKTTLLVQTIRALKDEYKIGVMEADIDSDVDAKTIIKAGADAVQLHTGGECHLTASMAEDGIEGFGDKKYDIIFLENIGNLVCPAEFDTGANVNVELLSVPEGDDKPLKYPLMFKVADIVLITKKDVAEYFDFDFKKAEENVHKRHDIPVIPVSSVTGEGLDKWLDFLRKKVSEAKEAK